jgi:hypothetical protein
VKAVGRERAHSVPSLLINRDIAKAAEPVFQILHSSELFPGELGLTKLLVSQTKLIVGAWVGRSSIAQLIFRAEFFKAFNHPQFTLPASTIGSTGVATISATARPSRQIQFALKFAF